MVQRLHEEGVFVNCVISPATPPGRALIRTSLMATHTREQLSRALEVIGRVGREVGRPAARRCLGAAPDPRRP